MYKRQVLTVRNPRQAVEVSRTLAGRLPEGVETKVSDLLDLMGYGDNNAFNRVLYSMAAIPVSYTHLDVYKRQVLGVPV